MKRFIYLLLSLALTASLLPFAALADAVLVNGFVVTTGTPGLYAGAGTGSAIAAGCAPAQAAGAKAVSKETAYTCKTPMKVAPQAKKPADNAQTALCPSGFTGSYPQTQSAVYDLATNSWTYPLAWTPSTPPAGACTPIKPAQPADVVVTNSCAPLLGSWTSTITTVYNAATNTWDKQPATPSSAPAGACTTPPAPAPVTQIPTVDKSKLPAPAVGFSSARRQPAPYPFNSFATAATSELPALPVGPQSPNDDVIGAVRIGCQFSHMNFEDAIVYPGQKDVSHLHAYFGNTMADRNLASLNITQVGNSTCSGGTLNRSAYWAPAIIDTTDGSPVVPSALLVYYKTGYGGVKPADVRAVPTGLRFISGSSSGNPKAPSGAGRFACVGGTQGVGWQTTIPARCFAGNKMIMEVDFPQCWDGKNLDSPDHKSHMHEATGSGCPTSHPVALPAIAYEIYYDMPADLSRMAKWRLSSDNYSAADGPGGYSAHGDYMMGWDVDVMKTFITLCDNASKDCHANLLGDGTWLY